MISASTVASTMYANNRDFDQKISLARAHQNSDVNIIKKQNQTKTRINKEKGTYRLLKKYKFFKVLANFQVDGKLALR